MRIFRGRRGRISIMERRRNNKPIIKDRKIEISNTIRTNLIVK